MAHINPTFPNIGDPNWGAPMLGVLGSIVGGVNTLDDRLTTDENTAVTLAGRVSTVEGTTSTLTSRATAVEGRVTTLEAAKALPLWQASTSYPSGALVVTPSGQIAQANSSFVSGTSYSATNWTVLSPTTATVSTMIATQATADRAAYLTYDGTNVLKNGTVVPISGSGTSSSGITLDTDGVPYYTPSGNSSIAFDTDGIPYLSGTGGATSTVRPRVGFIGDSITAGMANAIDSSTGLSYALGDSPATHAMLASDGRWDLITNAGVGGQTSTQIAARLQSDLIAHGCTVAVITSCYWNSQAQGITTGQVLADVQGMVATCQASGVVPILALPTPDGRTGSTTARIAYIATLTQTIRDYAFRNGIAVADLQSPIIDPANGQIATAYNADGSVHPNAAGYKALGIALGTTLNGILPPVADNLVRYAADPTDLLGGIGMFLNSSGGLGTGWFLTVGGGTPSITTDAAVPGKLQRLTASASTDNLILDTANFSGWSPGDVLQLSGIMTGSGGTAAPRIRFVVSGSPNPNTYADFEPQAAITRGRFSLLWKVPTGSTGIALRLQLQPGTGYFEVGRLSVRNLTTLGTA